jgi:hypothetical protein
VQLSPNGLFRILEIAPTTANVSGSKVNVGAAVGSSVAAFLVIAALAGYGGRRWYLTRRKYKQLKNVHTEVRQCRVLCILLVPCSLCCRVPR